MEANQDKECICRICQVEINTNHECVYNNEEKTELSEVGNLYRDLLNLEINEKEEYSAYYICTYCSLHLRLFNKFKTKAIETYNKLIKYHLNNENSKINEVKEKPIKLELKYSDELLLKETNDEIVEYENDNCCQHQDDKKIGITEVSDSNDETVIHNFTEEEFEEIQYLDQELLESESLKTENINTKGNEKSDASRLNCLTLKPIVKLQGTGQKIDYKFEIYPCKHCGSPFQNKKQLEIHRKRKHLRTKLSCNLCKKKFISEDNLKAHMRVHSGLSAYQCHECSKTFNQKAHYEYHMKGHRNERDVQCHLCGKGFLATSDLKVHIRVHNDERRYECDICGRKFRAHTHMTNHRYSHFEEKLKCDICLRSYSSPNVLRTHMKSVHFNEKPYKCEICGRQFKRKHHLKGHYKTHMKSKAVIT